MKRSLLIALTVLLSLNGINAQTNSKELKFISFNIRTGSAWATAADGDNCWANRRKAVVDMIQAERPDAIGLQEAVLEQVHYLDSVLAGAYSRIGVGRDDGRDDGEFMCIYFRRDRLELLDGKTYWLSPTPDSVSFGWDAACRRTVTIGRFRDRATDSTIVYMNTHLDHVGPQARRNSVFLLCSLADQYNSTVVLGGDMNSGISDSIFHPLVHHQLIDARQNANVTDNADTYNAYGHGPSHQIDHFFVKLKPGSRGILAFRTLNGNYGVPYISDHYPVVTVINPYIKQ